MFITRIFNKFHPRVEYQWVHSHNFLGDTHRKNERKTFWVIFICALSMFLEIGFGTAFNSLALVSDGIHMSSHVLAFAITWVSYAVSRRYSDDTRFVFGTGKVGDLAAFTSAIILFMIAMIILYDGVSRLIKPVKVDYLSAIPVAFLGLSVNIASGLILGGFCNKYCGTLCGDAAAVEDVGHGHDHGHGHR
jgi:divalent metal cation (Fe/Co/Zn/Cd) transporter